MRFGWKRKAVGKERRLEKKGSWKRKALWFERKALWLEKIGGKVALVGQRFGSKEFWLKRVLIEKSLG